VGTVKLILIDIVALVRKKVVLNISILKMPISGIFLFFRNGKVNIY